MADKRDQERRQSAAERRAANHGSGSFSNHIKLPDGVSFFEVKEGTFTVDVVPFKATAKNFAVRSGWVEKGELYYEATYFVHRDVGAENEAVICPAKTFGKKCPICEDRIRMMQKSDYDKDVVKALLPKERQLFWLRNRDDMKAGLKVLDISFHLFGKNLDDRISKAKKSKGYGDFYFPKGGKALELGTTEKSQGGYKFCEVTSIDFEDREKPLPSALLEQAVPLEELLVVLPYDQLKAKYLQLDPDAEDDDQEEDEDEAPKKKKKGKPADDEEDDDDLGEDDESDDDEDEEDEEPPKKGKKSKPADDDEDEDEQDEDDDDEDEEDDDEPTPKKKGGKAGTALKDKQAKVAKKEGLKTAAEVGLKVGDEVEHKKHGTCTIIKISGDGTSLTLEDEDEEVYKAVGVAEVGKPGKALKSKPADDDDDDDDAPPPKKKGKKVVEDDDDEDDDDEDDDDDDEEEEEAPPKKKRR